MTIPFEFTGKIMCYFFNMNKMNDRNENYNNPDSGRGIKWFIYECAQLRKQCCVIRYQGSKINVKLLNKREYETCKISKHSSDYVLTLIRAYM